MKLLERLARTARQRGMAANTVECYQRWVKEFLRFCAEPVVGPVVGPVVADQRDAIDAFIDLDMESTGGVVTKRNI
jgi:hypothetical protein